MKHYIRRQRILNFGINNNIQQYILAAERLN